MIGTGCTLGKNVFVDEGVVIGDRVKIQNNVSVYQGVELADEVFVGPSAVFTNDLRPRAVSPAWQLTRPGWRAAPRSARTRRSCAGSRSASAPWSGPGRWSPRRCARTRW